jgi:dihydropteroate synthase
MRIRDLDLRFGRRTYVMGIVNMTPDSFSGDGLLASVSPARAAVDQAERMAAEGADIIDVGGESTRPGAVPVSVEEELRRVIPVIEALHASLAVPVSIDTRRPEVMQAAVAAGAGFINDVNALQAPGAVELAARLGVPVCLMHMQGTPETMQLQPGYTDVVSEVRDFLLARANLCVQQGIDRERILLDPGFGFGKTSAHNLRLLQHLELLVACGFPVLAGLSRKSLIGQTLGLPVDERLHAGIALAVLAVWKGAAIVRCHDVRETREAVMMCEVVRDAG